MRVGLVGWAVRSGIGQMNADLARLAPWITDWLVPERGRYETDPTLFGVSGATRIHPCERFDDEDLWRAFVEQVDALLFVETPYVRGFDLAAHARAQGRPVVCIPMSDWLDPEAEWLESVDLFWAVTSMAAASLTEHFGAARVAGGRWGVDLVCFPFRERQICERFLFVNGWGGFEGRKGASLVAEAAALAPEVPLLVRSQTQDIPPMPSHVELRVEDLPGRAGLYAEGDALLAPSFWEGFGNGLYEAQACGLPVLTTDAPPMNECGGRLIPANPDGHVHTIAPVPRHRARPEALAATMRAMHGGPLAAESRAARKRVEARHDLTAVVADLHEALLALG